MLLLFIFLTTLIITLIVDQPHVEPVTEFFESLAELFSVEWILLPILLIILTTIGYLLIYKFHHWRTN